MTPLLATKKNYTFEVTRHKLKNSIAGLMAVLLSVINTYSQETEQVHPAPGGLLVFAGMELANGKRIDHYTIERSLNKKQWDKVTEIKSPRSWDEFSLNILKWQTDFSFQELPTPEILKNLWEDSQACGCIDSMKFWGASTIIRMAAGIVWYDKQAPKNTPVWYRVKAEDTNGKNLSETVSKQAQWPFVPTFDNITLNEKNIDNKLYYLKWESEGFNTPAYFKIYFYNNQLLTEATGIQTKYKIGNKTSYIFQDSTNKLENDRQYFLIPTDKYGNVGKATEITLVSKASAKGNYFMYTKASTSKKEYGIGISWKVNNPSIIKGIKIYRSLSFDKKEYELISMVPATDTTFTDNTVQPDKVYYYYLITESKLNDPPQKSSVFFEVAYEKLKPIQPSIVSIKPVKGGIELTIKASENYIEGIRVYRNNGGGSKLLPIGNLLKPDSSTITFCDTSRLLSGGRTYTYAATIINTSNRESELSNPVYAMPGIQTEPPAPKWLRTGEKNNMVALEWDDMHSQDKTIRGYMLFRRELPYGKFSSLLPSDSIFISNFYFDGLATPGKSYEYAVQTIDLFGGKSNSMAVATIEVKINFPPVPGNLSLSVKEGKVFIQWRKVETQEPYKLNIYKYQRGTLPKLLTSVSLKEELFVDEMVKNGELYFYFAKLQNVQGNEGAPSAEANIRLGSAPLKP